MITIEHDGQVHNPLGGAAYIFEEVILNWISKQTHKSKINISIGAQPNSSLHFGTLTVFSLAFALGAKLREELSKDTEVFFEVIDTAPFKTKEIEGIKYQISLRASGVADLYLVQYEELLAKLSSLTRIRYQLRRQEEFNNQTCISDLLHKIALNKNILAPILDPEKEKLRIRVACQKCGLTDKQSVKTIIEDNGIQSYCPEHGWFNTKYTESSKFEYNTPLRNLIRALIYAEDNKNTDNGFEWLRITGSDYAGFYQEQLLYKPASLLGYNAANLPIILYSPLITDWSGAKLSKSLYVKSGAYQYLPSYIVNYEHFKERFGESGVEKLYKEVLSWVENPYKLFRNYSVYYFMDLFDNAK